MSSVIHGKDIATGDQESVLVSSQNLHVAQYVWDTDTLSWVKQTKSTGGAGSEVSVTNFPAVYPITDNGGSITVDGSVNIIGSVPVTGVFWQTIQPVSFSGQSVSITGTVNTGLTQPLTNAELRASTVPVSLASTTVTNTVTTTKAVNTASTVTSVASSITNVTLKVANSSRKGLTVFNNGTANLFVKLGSTASTSSFTAKLTPGAYFEVPHSYSGIVDGIWDAVNGAALVTEIT